MGRGTTIPTTNNTFLSYLSRAGYSMMIGRNNRTNSQQFLKQHAVTIALLLILIYQQFLLHSSRIPSSPTSSYGSVFSRGDEGYDGSTGLEEPIVKVPSSTSKDTEASSNDSEGDENILGVDDYQLLFGTDVSQSTATTQSQAVSSGSKPSATVTIVTGTHLSARAVALDERTQHATCGKLAYSLHLLWVAWEVNAYARAKAAVKENLKAVANAGASCTLAGSRKHNMLWTFPMAWRPDSECDSRMRSTLATKSYIREKTKIYVNWFLLRPDLVTFFNMASVENVEVKIAVSVGADPSTAGFSKEGCPRFNTILDKRDVYKQRLLLVALSDIEHQLERIRRTVSVVYICSKATKQAIDVNQFASLLGSSNGFSVESDGCTASSLRLREWDKTHIGTMTRMRLLQGPNPQPVQKTVFKGPRLTFVAGLEGVGHHVFALLGRKHTTRGLYDALTDHLCDSAWDDNSVERYSPARENLVKAMREIRDNPSLAHKDGSNVFFLNTVYTVRDVNMYSYPWGGPRCFLKRYARVMCNIDIVEIARVAEEAGIDFRVILLKRSIGAAVVSASLHRPFGTLVSETRMLALSWALLKTGIENIDRKFTLEINYEDLINYPAESTAKLAEHIGFDKVSPLYAHFEQTLTQSAIDHPVGDGSRWKEEVDLVQMQFMSDLLGL